jgi:flagellar biosynthetic protein FliP
MLLQSMGIMTALAFVLGLIGVAVWVAKRFGGATVNPGARIQIEVVQRIPFGPKAGLAVVRVGEKVMAVSVGPDGIRPLFEVDEADRQRIVASSQIATPFASTADAGRAFAKMLPGTLGRMLDRTPFTAPAIAHAVSNTVANAAASELVAAPARAFVEIPSFLTEKAGNIVRPAAPADRAFQSVLNIAMSGATKLAIFAGFVALSAAASKPARAQGAPPAVTPVTASPVTTAAPVTTTTPATTIAPATSTTAAPTNAAPPAPALETPQLPAAPKVEVPAFVLPKGSPRTARPAQVRPIVARGVTIGAPKAVTDSTTKARADSTKLMAAAMASAAVSKLIAPRSRNGNGASSATPAPIAGSDDALAKMIPQMDIKLGDGKDGGLRLSGTVGIVVMMGLLTLIPTLLLMMTGFTRILIVLHFLKQAMGTQAAPPAQLLAAMALLLTGFVMAPTFSEVNTNALQPWMDGKITQVEMLQTGVKPMRTFMLKQTREADLKTFIGLSKLPRPNTVDDVPLHVLMSAFVASELRTSFQIGFMIYLPFIVIDAVVASVLMSMGMFMLPPAMISMPFKLLLFVLVDGWGLTIHALVSSFK